MVLTRRRRRPYPSRLDRDRRGIHVRRAGHLRRPFRGRPQRAQRQRQAAGVLDRRRRLADGGRPRRRNHRRFLVRTRDLPEREERLRRQPQRELDHCVRDRRRREAHPGSGPRPSRLQRACGDGAIRRRALPLCPAASRRKISGLRGRRRRLADETRGRRLDRRRIGPHHPSRAPGGTARPSSRAIEAAPGKATSFDAAGSTDVGATITGYTLELRRRHDGNHRRPAGEARLQEGRRLRRDGHRQRRRRLRRLRLHRPVGLLQRPGSDWRPRRSTRCR